MAVGFSNHNTDRPVCTLTLANLQPPLPPPPPPGAPLSYIKPLENLKQWAPA